MKPALLLLVPVPAATVYLCQWASGGVGARAGETVPFRPPAWVFGVAWPVLLVLCGISWALAQRAQATGPARALVGVTYALATALLGAWVVTYRRSKVAGVWVLVGAVAATLASFAQGTPVSKVLLAPLVAWLLLALLMNTAEVS